MGYRIAAKFVQPLFMNLPSCHKDWLEFFCNGDLWGNRSTAQV